MATSRGGADIRQFIRGLPAQLERKVLRGAGRAGANVIADEARDRCISSEVRESIKVRVTTKEGSVSARILTKGKGAYIAPWLEYGTSEHFISVDASQRGGMSVGRINSKAKEGSLLINGQFVGSTVLHPGARPHPFLRPALDLKTEAAVAAAQGYINSKIGPTGIQGGGESADEV